MQRGFIVLDFGSQLTQLIARRLRELGVYSEIHPFDYDLAKIKSQKPYGIVLSGGPQSVSEKDSPRRSVEELQNIAPVLGICYGMQLMAYDLGGAVEPSSQREYGHTVINWSKPLSPSIPKKQKVWMSHGDVLTKIPTGFEVLATSESNHAAVIKKDSTLAFQFHPEVFHTENGIELLKHFVFEMCEAKPDWDAPHIAEKLMGEIRAKVGPTEKVLCALSGGVDSSVVATLLVKALGPERVSCVFVDNGLLRKNEFDQVLQMFDRLGIKINGVRAEQRFLTELKGMQDPEMKRKTIGRVFIDVFKDEAKRLGKLDWLAQGTLYPDVIESVSPRGASVTIKSHHNVGGLPKELGFKLLEPLRELFKDEVRSLGKQLQLPEEFLTRHPFPGPGLAIRVLDVLNKENLDLLRECDHIYIEELKKQSLYNQIWQAFCVLLPVKTVGVQGDGRTYERVLAVRAVTSTDGMTADWYPFSPDFLRRLSGRITNEVRGINRVVYDITSKPPGTIEWE